jgi:thiamine pyrophosphokinase
MPAEVCALTSKKVVVVAGGHAAVGAVPALPGGAFVIAADGGVDRALALGLHVDLAVGDFDSVSASGLATAQAAGARIERHPATKDATDLELALDAALALAPTKLLVIGSDTGRFDHLLGSVLLLGCERYAAMEIDAYLGPVRLHVIRGTRTLIGAPGEVVSLFPVHGRAADVSTAGLEYPLHGETLPAGTSRGSSNVFAGHEARITVSDGCLVAVIPAPEREETP